MIKSKVGTVLRDIGSKANLISDDSPSSVAPMQSSELESGASSEMSIDDSGTDNLPGPTEMA
jgi:hypothetical protein